MKENSIKDVNEKKIMKWENRQKVRYLIFLVVFQKQMENNNIVNKKKWN